MKYSARRPHQRLSFDGLSRTPKAAVIMQRPLLSAPRQSQSTATMPNPVVKKRQTMAKKRRSLPFWLQVLLLAPLVLFAALFIQSGTMGQIALVGYGIAAFIWRIPSRATFTLALIAMITTTILLVVQGNISMAQNFATYTFLLLVVGVFTLSRELKKEGGRIYSSRHYR